MTSRLPELPEELHRYHAERVVGRGGFGVVLEAHDPELDRRVAIKLLSAGALDHRSSERFEDEARLTSSLSHPHIVKVFDHGIAATGEAWILYEFVEGSTLEARLAREGRMDQEEAARLGAQLGDALAHAHRRGVLHRDVKPGNILLRADGSPVLADFGLARKLDPETIRTTAGTALGTLAYLAPEVLLAGQYGPSGDQFSLAATLFEAVYGRRYRDRVGVPDLGKEAEAEPGTRMPPPDQDPAPRMRPSLERALSGVPEHRFADMGAFARALRGSGWSGPTEALVALPVQGTRIGDPVQDGEGGAGTRSGARSRARIARRLPAWTVPVVLIALSVAVGTVLLGRGSGPAPGSELGQGAVGASNRAPAPGHATQPQRRPGSGRIPEVRHWVGEAAGRHLAIGSGGSARRDHSLTALEELLAPTSMEYLELAVAGDGTDSEDPPGKGDPDLLDALELTFHLAVDTEAARRGVLDPGAPGVPATLERRLELHRSLQERHLALVDLLQAGYRRGLGRGPEASPRILAAAAYHAEYLTAEQLHMVLRGMRRGWDEPRGRDRLQFVVSLSAIPRIVVREAARCAEAGEVLEDLVDRVTEGRIPEGQPGLMDLAGPVLAAERKWAEHCPPGGRDPRVFARFADRVMAGYYRAGVGARNDIHAQVREFWRWLETDPGRGVETGHRRVMELMMPVLELAGQ